MNVKEIVPKLSESIAKMLISESKNLGSFVCLVIDGKECAFVGVNESDPTPVSDSMPIRKMIAKVLGLPYFALKVVREYSSSMDKIEASLEENEVEAAIFVVAGEARYIELNESEKLSDQFKRAIVQKTHRDFAEFLKGQV